jgi:hypothetical protein
MLQWWHQQQQPQHVRWPRCHPYEWLLLLRLLLRRLLLLHRSARTAQMWPA